MTDATNKPLHIVFLTIAAIAIVGVVIEVGMIAFDTYTSATIFVSERQKALATTCALQLSVIGTHIQAYVDDLQTLPPSADVPTGFPSSYVPQPTNGPWMPLHYRRLDAKHFQISCTPRYPRSQVAFTSTGKLQSGYLTYDSRAKTVMFTP